MAGIYRRPSRIAASLLLVLFERGEATTQDLCRELGIDSRILWSRVWHWVRRGIVHREGVVWRLTPDGKALVAKYKPWLEVVANGEARKA